MLGKLLNNSASLCIQKLSFKLKVAQRMPNGPEKNVHIPWMQQGPYPETHWMEPQTETNGVRRRPNGSLTLKWYMIHLLGTQDAYFIFS